MMSVSARDYCRQRTDENPFAWSSLAHILISINKNAKVDQADGFSYVRLLFKITP
jgi:hypothetical protein